MESRLLTVYGVVSVCQVFVVHVLTCVTCMSD